MRVSIGRMVLGLAAILGTSVGLHTVNAGELYEPSDMTVYDGYESCCACDSGCECGDLSLLNLVKPSDHCFDDFISPMINFVFFEDPRNVSELRPIFVNHWVPSTIGNNISAGGTVQLYALQFRVALTDRLSVIATKDGYIVDNTEGTLDTLMDDGWADVSAGLKYTLLRDPCEGRILSAGFTYEMPVGSRQALQAQGDGEFYFFLTGGQRLWDGNAHILSSVGYRLPADTSVQSQAIQWSNHFDVKLTDRIYMFTEVAWWHWTGDASNGLPLGVSGADLFNLSSTDVAGKDLVTQNVGFRFKPTGHLETGIAYEFPLTGYKDLTEGRLTADMILRF
ncbi:hypothetical protein [Bremerella cremea]|uniref:hypothetical protein n=1 Tax=Bremerella cremea TaxID=1031537 RepID=UPI0031E52ADB